MKNIFFFVLLMAVAIVGLSQNSKVDSLLLQVNNQNIEYSTYRPQDAKTVLLERKLLITSPPEAVILVKMGKAVAKDLVLYFNNEEKDWAIHLILSTIYDQNPQLVQYNKSQENWRKKSKKYDYEYWMRIVR